MYTAQLEKNSKLIVMFKTPKKFMNGSDCRMCGEPITEDGKYSSNAQKWLMFDDVMCDKCIEIISKSNDEKLIFYWHDITVRGEIANTILERAYYFTRDLLFGETASPEQLLHQRSAYSEFEYFHNSIEKNFDYVAAKVGVGRLLNEVAENGYVSRIDIMSLYRVKKITFDSIDKYPIFSKHKRRGKDRAVMYDSKLMELLFIVDAMSKDEREDYLLKLAKEEECKLN
jgi:hypothetical protein